MVSLVVQSRLESSGIHDKAYMTRILVVDDDPDVLELLTDALNIENFEVRSSLDGDAAMIEIASHEFDLLVLDWMLPTISGLELCKHYRKVGGKSPVMILTGKANVKDKVSGLAGGADDYVTKPFQVEELLARVKALLRRSSGSFPNT
jgi:DNA-binding response OmpR family regulator